MESNSLPIPKDVRWRRLLAVALFLAVLYFFRGLAPVLIIFVIFERGLGYAADQLTKYTRIHRKGAIAGLLALLAGGVGLLVFFFVKRLLAFVELARRDGASWVESVTKSTLIQKMRDRLGIDSQELTSHAKDYALQVFHYATATAYVALFLFVGFILAVMYLFERDEIDEWMSAIRPKSILGTMSRWIGYVADAIAITVRLQIVVAIFNAVFTLPLLILLGLPNVPLLFLLVLASGMVPVVGGVMSGIVLCLVAYDAKGVVGVGVFLGVTFVLGKVESYYLSPRLTAQHVKLPGLVLVVALLMFETIFGFWGLFLSFPALYVASRISNEWKEEEDEIRLQGGTLSMPPPTRRSAPTPAPAAVPASTPPPPPPSETSAPS
ncbi:MAG: AI-2E family transporter [Polyangiaceae bacterium]|nr:AI-2E family transporter [Polyangiaceae bacterium]